MRGREPDESLNGGDGCGNLARSMYFVRVYCTMLFQVTERSVRWLTMSSISLDDGEG